MLIYQAPSDRFIDDVRENTISDIMSGNYKARLGKDPGVPEFVSWQNRLSRVRDLLEPGKDVKIGDFAMPWEIHDKIGDNKLMFCTTFCTINENGLVNI